MKRSADTPSWPPLESVWEDMDNRFSRTVRVNAHRITERKVVIYCPGTRKTTVASLKRFNGKSGGYRRIV